ncbi:fimbrial protein [Rosenbergiella sp. S61]|uniref:Fimbrial protein n=1 Tax=Rosenbergiella gaditana TaxID=2726987 RepID=A0ABS5T0P3_9GAMM|nr:fimbrial protein [Rosenbergiella gaditana]MBT0725040.1 fimbrial protein [Rosenbergiella gaditana]
MKYLIFLLTLFFSVTSDATCYTNHVLQHSSPISIDLSDKLSAQSPTWTTTVNTTFSGTFTCTTNSSSFLYTPLLINNGSNQSVIGFNNGKYKVLAEITNSLDNKTLSGSRTIDASQLNVPLTIKFSLINKEGNSSSSNVVNITDALILTDTSGLSILEIINWPLKQLYKIVTWLLNNFTWPYDERDMYSQPMILTYAPKSTSCSLTNSGITINLPKLSIQQVASQPTPGFTSFNLNFSCNNLGTNNTTDRAIDIFLSSSTLLPTDQMTLIDNSNNSAKGVGFRVVNIKDMSKPLIFSTSQTVKGNGTSIFSIPSNNNLNSHFSIPLGAYYYVWDKQKLSQGTLNSTAVVNIVYP